jgi:excisionase family DNA binding protein
MEDPKAEYLTIPEAAARMRISRASLYKLIKEEKVPTYHPLPGSTRLLAAEVDAYMIGTKKQ